MNKKTQGFTLVEIMIVVAIIAILAAIAIPNFIAYRKTSKMNACIANLKQLDTATEAWRVKTKNYTDAVTMANLVGTDGNGFVKVTLKCPEKEGEYTPPAATATGTDAHWTCKDMGADADYPHKITD